MPSAVGSSIATVAVLETKADSRHVMAPNAMMILVVLRPTPGKREDAEREPPRQAVLQHRLGEDERADEGEHRGVAERQEGLLRRHRPQEGDRGDPEEGPPTGIGTGSVIHSTTTPSSTAARVCCA
jgi:hypothetical protein